MSSLMSKEEIKSIVSSFPFVAGNTRDGVPIYGFVDNHLPLISFGIIRPRSYETFAYDSVLKVKGMDYDNAVLQRENDGSTVTKGDFVGKSDIEIDVALGELSRKTGWVVKNTDGSFLVGQFKTRSKKSSSSPNPIELFSFSLQTRADGTLTTIELKDVESITVVEQ